VFLLNVYSKGGEVTLTMAERNEFRDVLALLARAYREERRRLPRKS